MGFCQSIVEKYFLLLSSAYWCGKDDRIFSYASIIKMQVLTYKLRLYVSFSLAFRSENINWLDFCSPMKAEEKRELYQRMCKLPSSSLSRVMEILSLGNAVDSTTENIQINLEALVFFFDQAVVVLRMHAEMVINCKITCCCRPQ